MARKEFTQDQRNFKSTAPRADVPVVGFYRRRLVKGGPWVAVRIWFGPPRDPVTDELLDRSPRFQALRSGLEVDIWAVWPECSGEPLTETDYYKLLASPSTDPLMPVNLNFAPTIF